MFTAQSGDLRLVPFSSLLTQFNKPSWRGIILRINVKKPDENIVRLDAAVGVSCTKYGTGRDSPRRDDRVVVGRGRGGEGGWGGGAEGGRGVESGTRERGRGREGRREGEIQGNEGQGGEGEGGEGEGVVG